MLSVLCLSLVPVLRCADIKRIEFSTLLIPPGVELVFSIALFCKRDGTRGGYDHLLCIEGISYFLLALLEFLAHTIPVLHQDLFAFKVVDIILGGLSSVPLLFFTLWFLFSARQDLTHMVPARLRKPAIYVLIVCIPFITISSSVGSFLGISYGSSDGVNTVGLIDERAKFLWSLLNMFSLGTLAVFETVAFFLLLARLMNVVHHKRRTELANGTGEIHHSRGIILMNLGMLLSLLATLIGFTQQSFAVAITRRGTKTAGRLLITLGLLKGWDYLEDVRLVLQEPSKSKRISSLPIRQLFSNIRSPSAMAQTSERHHQRVSVEYPRGRAPRLNLRFSEFDFSPIMRTLRSSPRSSNPFGTHLSPETPPTVSVIGEIGEDSSDVQYPHHKNTSSDVLISPMTGPTPKVSSSTNRTINPRPSTPLQEELAYTPGHTREGTISSTMSNLQMEVMTISGSPPDPGFVLPVPSRSRGRQNYDLYMASTTRFAGLQRVGDIPGDYGYYLAQMNESNTVLPSLEPPWPRQSSWMSGNSDASLAVVSTVAKLRRAHTTTGVMSSATRRAAVVTPHDNVHTGQRNTVVVERPYGNPRSTAYI